MLGELKKKNLLLLVILILVLCVALPLLAMADTTATVTVGSTELAVAPGDDITLPVSISNNPGIGACGLTITYDSTILTLNSITNTGGLCTGTFQPNIETPGSAYLSWVTGGSANMTGNGELFYLNFTVNESAATDDYEVSCTLTDGAASNFTTYDFENVAVTFDSGTIQVESTTPGDFSGTVVAAPLADQSAEPLTTLYDSYSVSYVDGTATIRVTNLRSHTNSNAEEGYWVGVGMEIPAGTTYSDIQFGTAADSLASAGMTEADFTDNGTEYMSVYVKADNADQVRTFYVSFDGGSTVYSITIDCTNVTLYQENPSVPAFSGTVVAAPLADQSAEPLTTLYDSYSVSYVDGAATITATNLRSHTNANAEEGYWVGVGLEIPAGTTYSDIQFGTAADSLASAGMTEADFTNNETEYMAIYVSADNADQVRTFYVSFDGGSTVYSITIDCTNVTLYQENEDNTIALSDFTDSVYTITEGGEYQLAADVAGLIKISTTDAVTIVGLGSDTSFSSLSIDCTVSNVALTIEDLYISGLYSNNPAIDFLSGSENELTISGTSVFNVSSGTGFSLGSGSMVHVPLGSSLTLDGDGTLYMYKTGGGANIGGNYGEVNGSIIFNGGTWFMKASQTGALIGTGQGNGESLVAGDVTINDGAIYAIHVARGAVIGGGGMSGGFVGSGGNVYVNGGTLYLGADFSGASIGGGGGQSDNATVLIADGYEVPSNLYINGGSIKNIISSNAASLWGVTVPGSFIVDDTCISATKITGSSGTTPAYLCEVDLSDIAANANGNKYIVKIGNNTIYSGNGYEYDWCGSKSADIMSYYPANAGDTNLYLYLSGEDHILTINGENFDATWDSETSTFSVTEASSGPVVWNGNADASWYDSENPLSAYTITTPEQLAGLAFLVNNGNDFDNVTFTLANDIILNSDGSTTSWTPIGKLSVSEGSNKEAVISSETPFAGTFDGSGHAINGFYISSSDDIQGLFGDLTGTVTDFTLNGSMDLTGTNIAGSVVAFIHGGTISGVTNNATINASSMSYVGGICGYNLNGTISCCTNLANINAYKEVGGIAGRNAGTIIYTYNAGTVDGVYNSSKNGVGGIVGKNGNHYTAKETGIIESCYNSGTVGRSGQKWVGGIAGFQNSLSTTTNCYDSGTIIVGAGRYAAIIGQEEGTSTNNYSLDTLSNDTNETVIGIQLTDAELKVAAPLLGGAFVNVTDGYPVLFWKAGLELKTITVDSTIENGTVTVPAKVTEGNTVTVTVTPNQTCSWVADSLTYTVAGEDPVIITATDGVYSFIMPAADITITASFTGPIWTGSGTAADPYQITSADGLVALATYTNEGNTTKDVYWQLSNDIDLATVCSETLGSWTPIGNKQISSSDVVTGYAFQGDFDGNGKSIQNLYVISADGYLGLFGAIGGNDNHDGSDGYGTVHDFDLYGYVINTLQSSSSGSFPDFVGGVCGKLYAGGTISDVINHASVLAPCVYNVGGIVGFAGTNVLIGTSESGSRYTNEPSGDNTYVLRCGNEARVIGYNKVGGIVGENAAQVMYCYNKGQIIPHLSGSGGGTGGIVGRNGNNNTAYEEGTIAYCYNAGKVTDNGYSWTWNDGTSNADNSWKRNSDTKWIGGITGFNNVKSKVRNCYASEFFTTLENSYTSYKNPIVGHLDTNNVYNEVLNVYCLDTLWYNSSAYDAEHGTPLTEEQFKVTTYGSSDILTLIGAAFMADNTNINSGYPILRWQVGESIPSVTSISIETAPTKVNYDATEVFDPTGMIILAIYSDGSKSVVTDYTYSTNPLIAGTTSIDITYGGLTVTQAITVSSLSLSGIAITTNPTNLVYAADETFDPTGMVVTVTYNDNTFTNKEVTYDATGEAGYTYNIDETGLLKVTYTEDEITQTATLQLTFLSSNAPTTLEDVYQLDSADDMVWFANQVNIGVNLSINGTLKQDIDASPVDWEPIGSNKMKYSGHFDGNNKKITINVTGTDNYSGLFGYLDVDGSIENLTVDGVVSGGNNTAGIIGYLNGATISGCTNAATVNGNQYTGGIVGNSTGEANIIDCINTGVIISSTHTVGGIVGNGGLTGLIENCSNDGTISGQNKVGGIIGNDYSTATLSKCYNSGSVTGTSDDTTPSAATNCAGGIAGFVNKAATIDQCYNSGTISGGVVNIGGIAGYLNNANSIVTNCYNLGTVNSSSIYAQASVGGVIGTIKYSGASVQNCYNAGEIIADMTSSSYIAGVIGYAADLTNVTNNYYLNTTADLASGFTTSTSSNAMAKTSSAMSSAYFVTLLGSAYIEGDIYPALRWQDLTIGSDDVTVEDGGTVEIGSEQGGNRIVLDSDLVTEMTGANNISLELTTQNGTFEFDSEATAEILEAAGNSSVTFNATLLTESSDSGIQELIDGGNMVFDFSLTANGSSIFTSASSGSVTIRIPYTMDFKTIDNIKIYYINSEGEKTQITPVTYEDGYLVFSVTHFSTYSIEYDGLNIWADFNNDTVDFNGNDQITVKIYAKNNVETTYGSYQAEINFNSSLLTFNSDESSIGEGTSNIELYSSGIVRIGYASEESVEQSLSTDGTLLATLVFDVNTGITDSITGTICIGDASFGASGDSEDQSASIGADLSYTLHNIKLTFQAGTGSTLSKTYAYVKYNQPGIFTDDTYTTNMDVPAPTARTGYRLAADTDDEPLWIDSLSIEYTSDEIVASSFSVSDTFTVQAVMQYTVEFYDSTGTQIESTQAVDINACATAPDDPTLTDYLFRGWYIVTTASDDYDGSSTLYDKATIDATPVTTDIIYKAYFDIPSFNVTVPDCVNIIEGITDDQVTYGVDVIFNIDSEAADGYVVMVTYQVDGGEQCELTADSGVYTLPGTEITGEITILVSQVVDGEVTFVGHDEYMGAASGYKVLLLESNYDSMDRDTMLYTFNTDTELFYSEEYGTYVAFVSVDETVISALEKLALDKTASTMVVNYDGNVNNTNGVTTLDAQIIYDLLNSKDVNGITDLMRFCADYDGNKVVTTNDAYAIICQIFNITE